MNILNLTKNMDKNVYFLNAYYFPCCESVVIKLSQKLHFHEGDVNHSIKIRM